LNTTYSAERHIRQTGDGLFIFIIVSISIFTFTYCSASPTDIPGGITGTVYTSGDSLSGDWVPLPDAVVIVERSKGDSVITSQAAEIEVLFNTLNPKIQVAQPGAPLKIIATGTRPTRLTAKKNSGKKLFSVALPLPSLEVLKQLSTEGIITFHNDELDPDSILARIIVTPHLGWTKTDTAGLFLIPGVSPSCHAVWCYDPLRGSVFDTVCVEPARAVPSDLYLPDVLYSQ